MRSIQINHRDRKPTAMKVEKDEVIVVHTDKVTVYVDPSGGVNVRAELGSRIVAYPVAENILKVSSTKARRKW